MQHKFRSSVVERAREGEDRALDQLAEEVVPILLRWCTRLGGPKVDPEDVAHDVLVVMVQKLPTLRDPDRFGAWLFQITRKQLANHRRKSWARQWLTGFFPTFSAGGAGTDDGVWQAELSSAVQEALDVLPVEQREALVLCDIEEMKDAEAAVLLEIPEGTLKSRLRLARKRFREFLAEREITPEMIGARDMA